MQGVEKWWGVATFYTAKFVWEEMYSDKVGWINDWDLHVANYTTADYPYYVPRGWTWYTNNALVSKGDQFGIWQYSADGNRLGHEYGVSSWDIDLNRMSQWYWDRWIPDEPGNGEPGNNELPADALQQLWIQGLAHGWELVQ